MNKFVHYDERMVRAIDQGRAHRPSAQRFDPAGTSGLTPAWRRMRKVALRSVSQRDPVGPVLVVERIVDE